MIVWLSLDPVRGEIDLYPHIIANKIEKAYQSDKERCILGEDFFNATVHFDDNMYQTTPGQHFGRGAYKQPGYRTVCRMVSESDNILIFGRRVYGEWRMCEESKSERSFLKTIPRDCVLFLDSDDVLPRIWTAEDLTMKENEQTFIVWQWCSVTNKNFDRITEADWHPYLNENNKAIETSYKSSKTDADIRIGQRDMKVHFTSNFISCFATQRHGYKSRAVRRKIITGRELVELLNKLWPISNFALKGATEELLQNLHIAHRAQSFLCPITQEVMTDPVMTEDGHSYERDAIERW